MTTAASWVRGSTHILTCHQCATVRWHLGHGLWLWHHWVDTTRSLDRPAWESHVVPQTVAISTCMSTSMGVRIWHIKGNLDMSSTCDNAMVPVAWTVAMASLGRHREGPEPACEAHVVPQTVAIATCMSTSMGVRIWHIKGILTCHQRATVRWHLDHRLWLRHHWVHTTRSLDWRGSRMLLPKRRPLPLACRHRWEYRFGTLRAS